MWRRGRILRSRKVWTGVCYDVIYGERARGSGGGAGGEAGVGEQSAVGCLSAWRGCGDPGLGRQQGTQGEASQVPRDLGSKTNKAQDIGDKA